MKKYIFFAPNIHIIGGGQLYVAGKAKYLESHGWQVFIFYTAGKNYGESEIPQLTKYVYGGSFKALSRISYKCHPDLAKQALQKMLDTLRIDPTVENEIIIESMMCIYASYAEILAERIHARHFFNLIEENYRTHYPPYEAEYENNLDFFYFKYKRNELIADESRFHALFQGYPGTEKFVTKIPANVNTAPEQYPIQDVENEKVDQIQRAELNIAYIGRTEKRYVPAIFKGVYEFVKNHPDKKILFVIVGVFISEQMVYLTNNLLVNLPNLKLIALGNLVPIPRSLFKKLDVVIAGAGSAVFSAYEHVPVIVANAESDKTAGCLYYDTDDYLFAEPKYSYAEMLERVLINREYDNRQINLPEGKSINWHYEQMLKIQRDSSLPALEYFTEKFKVNKWRAYISIFPFNQVPKGSRVVIYGANETAQDYIKQIRDGKYCQLVGIVADDHMHFDKTVQPPEKLTEMEYDVIVIAEIQDQNKISKIVDNIFRITGERKICYDYKEVLL